ncbi:ATP-binding protein [Stenoxybacter acetivorans]|uniref:ATP-binding protein n=1 Tax=Stenoxybacter acetivorans TaxID=422441 RepID=UPI00068A0D6B|nr:ATP-binding protein [Stenoxybacter acetivorans]
MKIDLKMATERLFPAQKISFNMIYEEAIANALDAGATDIKISLKYNKKEKNEKLSYLIIQDNGEGFTNENFRQFSNLMEAKDPIHKGQGRLVYLHYFKKNYF